MSAIDRNPGTMDMLSQFGYRFQIKKLPNVNFFLQEVSVPDITLPSTQQPTPFVSVPVPGDHLEYSPLDISFKVDEDLNNYIEIHNWIRGLGFPESTVEYGNLARKPRVSGEGIYSDASLIITTNLKNPNIEVIFEDAYPVYLGKISLNTTDTDVKFVTCNARFAYTKFEIRNLA
jgi:hypothetical protein